MQQQPSISIIVPCYNQGALLSETLESVADLHYDNWDCIIVNDGSTDDTATVAQSWAAKDPRFKYLAQENKGLSGARNTGIRHSKADFILPLDADDLVSPDYAKLAMNVFRERPETGIVFCEARKFGVQKGIWKIPPYSLANMLAYNCIFCSAFFRRSDWEKVGGYSEDLKKGFEDWDFWLKLISRGAQVIKLPGVHFFYRTKKSSMTTEVIPARGQTYQQIFEKHKDFILQHIGNPLQLYQDSVYFKHFRNRIDVKTGIMLFKPLQFIIEKLKR